jgi:phosphate/phosphite/phosphonate ABC transporter binding protein
MLSIIAMASREGELLLFGYAAHAESRATQKKMAEFADLLSTLSREDISMSGAKSYDALTNAMRKRAYDLAWLPPIPFLTLEGQKAVTPLVSHRRGGLSAFHCVVIVRASSRIRTPVGLRGKRAAWVDPKSAAGFVLPRIGLAALGVDARTAFAEERFYGSHEAVVRAVVGDRADFGATYARLDRSGGVVHGAWAELPGAEESIRVLVTFGKIPGDVIVARSDLAEAKRERVTRALVGMCNDVTGQMLVRDLFGVHEFQRWKPESYEALGRATAQAEEDGLLDIDRIAAD